MKKILFVAAEAVPFAKTGGLGDVVGTLPLQMIKKGVDVRIVIPAYRDIPKEFKDKAKVIAEFNVNISWRNHTATIWTLKHEGITIYFIDQPYYFDRSGLYGYFDDAERFAFFSKAALALIEHIDFKPDIIHAHDWHCALIPVYLEHFYRALEPWKEIKTVFTIHNLAYQGRFSPAIIEDVLGLNWGYFTGDKLEFNGCVNIMKGGILYANYVTTVSPNYASEIQTPARGEGLEGVLQACANKFCGILNGIDYAKYNPWKDPDIKANYHSGTTIGSKSKDKDFLWEKFKFKGDKKAPVLGMVSRIVPDKGFDIVCEAIPELIQSGAKIVILGAGEQGYEEYLRHVADNHKESMAVITEFNEILARQIYAGVDMFLMPSIFEPCGIGQMIAMRYGAVPLVHETGGLKDTIKPYNKFTGGGTGFGFNQANVDSFLNVYNQAVEIYKDEKAWKNLMKNAMKEDFSWNKSVEQYIALYDTVLKGV